MIYVTMSIIISNSPLDILNYRHYKEPWVMLQACGLNMYLSPVCMYSHVVM